MGAAGEPGGHTTLRRSGAPVGVYRPRRPRASPLYRLLADHFQTFATVYDERFAPRWGPWRRVVPAVVEKFLACGILEHGFARVRCGGCRHEYLLAFSCKCRYFCPSCHAKRLAVWSGWLEETLLAPVPHRQVVLAVPKRLRPSFLYRRALLGDLARLAARTLTAFIRATTGERALSVGIVASIQTHGSLANWHPHLHLLVTDGGFRPDGTFVPLPLHDVATVTEAFRRAVLTLFVKREMIDINTAASMLAWPHSGFHVHDGVWVPAEERAFATRASRRAPPLGRAAPPNLRGRPAALSPLRHRHADRRGPHRAARDRPGPHASAPPGTMRTSPARPAAAPAGGPPRPLGVSHACPRRSTLASGGGGVRGWAPRPARGDSRPARPVRYPASLRRRPPPAARCAAARPLERSGSPPYSGRGD